MHLLGATMVACCLGLAVLAWQQPVPLWPPLGLYILAWLAFAGGVHCKKLSPSSILFWAFCMRLCVLCAPPLFEDDHYRYLWDGYLFLTQGSPYQGAPLGYFNLAEKHPEQLQMVLGGINYPDVPTIYPPVSQAGFLLAAWIAPGQWWAWKFVLAGFDLLILGLLYRFFGARALLLYAWNPLLLVEGLLNAHTDLIGISLVFLAWKGWASPRKGVSMLGGAAAGFAIGARWLALLPLAFLVVHRFRWSFVLPMVVALGAVTLPFLLPGDDLGLTGMRIMAEEWTFNPWGFAMLAGAFGDALARTVGGCVLAVALACLCFFCWRRKLPVVNASLMVWAAFFLVSPVINAWYMLWLFPWLCIKPSYTGFAAMAAVSLTWLTGLNLGSSELGLHELHPVALPLQIAIVITGLCLDLWLKTRPPSLRVHSGTSW